MNKKDGKKPGFLEWACANLSTIGIDYISPITLKKAKNNKPDIRILLWRALHDLILLQMLESRGETCDGDALADLWNEVVKDDSVPPDSVISFVIHYITLWGYSSPAFVDDFDVDTENVLEVAHVIDSSELLLAFGWLLSKFQIFERIEKNTETIEKEKTKAKSSVVLPPYPPDTSVLPATLAKCDETQREVFSQKTDLNTIEELCNKLFSIWGKLQRIESRLVAGNRDRVVLDHLLRERECITRPSSATTTNLISGSTRTMFDLYMSSSAKILKKFMSGVSAVVESQVNRMEMGGKFWAFMMTVLIDSVRAREGKTPVIPKFKSIDNNDLCTISGPIAGVGDGKTENMLSSAEGIVTSALRQRENNILEIKMKWAMLREKMENQDFEDLKQSMKPEAEKINDQLTSVSKNCELVIQSITEAQFSSDLSLPTTIPYKKIEEEEEEEKEQAPHQRLVYLPKGKTGRIAMETVAGEINIIEKRLSEVDSLLKSCEGEVMKGMKEIIGGLIDAGAAGDAGDVVVLGLEDN